MRNGKTVFIVGAGASKELELPLGDDLKNKVEEMRGILMEKVAENDESLMEKYLNGEERQEFISELLSTFAEAVNTKEWSSFEDLFDDWKATANAASDPDLSKALLE